MELNRWHLRWNLMKEPSWDDEGTLQFRKREQLVHGLKALKSVKFKEQEGHGR